MSSAKVSLIICRNISATSRDIICEFARNIVSGAADAVKNHFDHIKPSENPRLTELFDKADSLLAVMD